jgi:hypothetical protein
MTTLMTLPTLSRRRGIVLLVGALGLAILIANLPPTTHTRVPPNYTDQPLIIPDSAKADAEAKAKAEAKAFVELFLIKLASEIRAAGYDCRTVDAIPRRGAEFDVWCNNYTLHLQHHHGDRWSVKTKR